MKNIIIAFIFSIIGAIVSLMILLSLSPFLEYIGFIKNGNEWKYDPIALLSINVGILQAILGIGAVVAALLVFINFQSTRDKLNKIDNSIIEMRKIIDKHDEQIKKEFDKDNIIKVQNINSPDNNSKEVNDL